jgi:HSP20 family protein
MAHSGITCHDVADLGKEAIMPNITRHDPYAIDDIFDDLMKGYIVRPVHYPAAPQTQASIKMDVHENDHAYTVHAEIPGVRKEEIHVTIDGSTVAISAETRRESEQKEGDKVLRSERYYGKLYRSFTLGQDLDEANARARFENGVLTLTLPKKGTASAKKIAID